MHPDRQYPVLIFKQGRSPISHGALGIARTLGRMGIQVYAIVESAYTPLAASRYITATFLWESWPCDRESFVTQMAAISRTIGRPAVLIPMDDLSAIFVAENSTILDQWFLFPHLPWNLPRRLADKSMFYSLCRELGIPHARFMTAHSTDEVREFLENNTFPIVVKAAKQWRLPDDSFYNPRVICDRGALLRILERTQWGELVLQEYIPGEDWIYNGYCNYKLNTYLNFTGKKLLTYPAGAGSAVIGISITNEALRHQSETFLRAISFSGICDIDWRLDKRDGQYKILDCNPRIGLNFQMFENDSAIDVARAQYLDLTGRKIEITPMIEGRLFAVESLYLRLFLRGGSQVTTENSSTLNATRKLAWWSVEDPLPFLMMAVRIVLEAITRRTTEFINIVSRVTGNRSKILDELE